jgi:hypothetical protein
MRWQAGYLEKHMEEARNGIGIILANHLKQCPFNYLFEHIRSQLGRSLSERAPTGGFVPRNKYNCNNLSQKLNLG